MGSITRAAALAAAAVALGSFAQQAAAGFVYSSTLRSVSVAASGASDSDSSNAGGVWFGSASLSGAGYSGLANHGSSLSMDAMDFVGAAQALANTGSSSVVAQSLVDITFVAQGFDGASTLDVSWIIGLSDTDAGGAAFVSVVLTDLTSNTVRLALSDDRIASGSLTLDAGRSYRLEILADANVANGGGALASYNANFTAIPGPGALALVACAGAIGLSTRRRR